MARKESSDSAARGLGDIIGFALLTLSFLLFVALFSADRGDLRYVKDPPNLPIRNLIGPLGAHLAYWHFLLLGAGGYLVPLAFLGFGLAHFFARLAYLKRSVIWAVILLLSLAGLFDLYSATLGTLNFNLDSGSAGGLIGQGLNQFAFKHWLGKVGATTIFAAFYLISLYYLTDHRVGDWVRSALGKKPLPDKLTPEERDLQKRATELEKQARDLQQQLAKGKVETADGVRTGPELGADLKPVPEPTVRDLSIPQARPVTDEPKSKKDKAKDKEAPKPAPEAEEKPGVEGETIPAAEIRAATTADILGKASVLKTKGDGESSPDGADRIPGEPNPASALVPAVLPPRPKLLPKKPKPVSVAATPKIGNYQLPALDLLQSPDMTIKPTESREELMGNAQLMKNTLAQFDIEVALGDITKGPTITRYELHPAPGVKLEKIQALSNNLAAALKAERLNILTPIPGKSSVGVEVPNAIKTKVILRDILESDEWIHTKARIPVCLGKDVYGQPMVADLADMPHVLIAGSTGSGKSVCINSIIASLLYRFSPDQLRFVMIDPKVVEMQQYNTLPHLVVPVVTDPKKVILALRWVVSEMEKRYQIFAKVGVRNIKSFNERPKDKPAAPSEPELPLVMKKEKIEPGSDGFAVELDEEMVTAQDELIIIPEKLSYIVVIIDELADLMLVAPAEVEMAIARITQMARAAGIHCIVATQRPSVDVITGVIKANIPARIAFQVAARVDSRTILDAMGADKLLGKGDMLYLPPGSAKLIRVQGALVTDQEIQSIVDFISVQGKPSYEMEIHQQLSRPVASLEAEEAAGSGEDEALIEQCIEVIRSEQKASVSLLQRRLRLGYGRAARIMDELEDRGIVGPGKGAEPRDILIDLDGTGMDGSSSPNPV